MLSLVNEALSDISFSLYLTIALIYYLLMMLLTLSSAIFALVLVPRLNFFTWRTERATDLAHCGTCIDRDLRQYRRRTALLTV